MRLQPKIRSTDRKVCRPEKRLQKDAGAKFERQRRGGDGRGREGRGEERRRGEERGGQEREGANTDVDRLAEQTPNV